MRTIVVALFMASLVVGSGFTLAQTAGEESDTAAEVKRAILENFKYSNANKRSVPDSYSREGALEFWSSGGMLHEVTPGGRPERYEVLSLSAKHVRVIPLVEGQAAVAHYYSEGTLKPQGYPAVSHYLTRVTQVFVKEDGKWKIRSSHWSPLQGGAGTSQTAEAKTK